MAEISYPFAEDTPGGGTKTVSQVEWQRMSQLWSGDGIDFQLIENAYTSTALPFSAAIVGSDIVVQAGSAWVGGFYYKNTSPFTQPAPTNSGTKARIDRVILRADMAASSVNLAIKTGTPSSNPAPPALERTPGGVWEVSLWLINLAASNGARTLTDTRAFKSPSVLQTPWNSPQVSEGLSPGNFILDMDSNTNSSQWEAFNGRDGFVVTRHLGKPLSYTPSLINNASSPDAARRVGRWRYISSNSYWVSVNINNDKVRNSTGSGFGITLPVAAGKPNYQSLSGVIYNPSSNSGMPNMMALTARINPGSTSAFLYTPNWTNPAGGLDNLRVIPANSRVEFSGVIEANQFNE